MRRLNLKDKEKLQKAIKNIKSTNLKIETLLFEVLQEYITENLCYRGQAYTGCLTVVFCLCRS